MFSDDSDFAMAFWPAFLYWFFYFAVFVYGAVVGSFLNVVIYRLPMLKEGEKWLEKINGKSYCPHCGNYLRPWQNVPLFGFLILRGKCYFCKSPISWRYFMVEFTTACLWAALYCRLIPFDLTNRIAPEALIIWFDFGAQALFGALLIAMVFIDLDHFIAPDELNLVGFFIGLLRDVGCLGLIYLVGSQVQSQQPLRELIPQYVYFGWLPRGLVGALLYGFVLYMVAFVGFIYYAKGQRESLGEVVKRFWTMEELSPDKMTDAEKQAIAEEQAKIAEDEKLGPPPRLRFSPGFLAILCCVLLIPSLKFAAPLVFLIPLLGFIGLSRNPGESTNHVIRRFFSANDLAGPPEERTVVDSPSTPSIDLPLITNAADLEALATANPLPTDASLVTPEEDLSLTLQQEADNFAREAESGRAGGMGLGDVKLAAAIGAMLGPGMALLSLFFATLIGAVVGIIFTRMHNRSLRYGVPFVPFMAAGAIIVLLFGDGLVNWYLTVSGIRKPQQDPPAITRPLRPRRQNNAPAVDRGTPDPVAPYVSR